MPSYDRSGHRIVNIRTISGAEKNVLLFKILFGDWDSALPGREGKRFTGPIFFYARGYCLWNQWIYQLSAGNDMQAKDPDRTRMVFFAFLRLQLPGSWIKKHRRSLNVRNRTYLLSTKRVGLLRLWRRLLMLEARTFYLHLGRKLADGTTSFIRG